VDHELLLLMKGFTSEEDAAAAARPAVDLGGRVLLVPDEGFDIGSYLVAARQAKHDVLCFLNSFSEIRTDAWLSKLSEALTARTGIVGASGSWNSHLSWVLLHLGIGPYVRAFRRTPERRRSLAAYWEATGDRRSPARRAYGALRTLRRYLPDFRGFPASHVRTNAFLVTREAFLTSVRTEPCTKHDALVVESGRRSLTTEIERQGRQAVVVGADGTSYGTRDWAASETFWQARQENLMVSDNQTRQYEDGDLDHRTFLSVLAWGEHARPV
jgi:hypothetical protein